MTTNELRIGNYLIHEGNRIQVKNIGSRSINLEYEGITVISWIPIEEVAPIPLTTQIIQRIGFRWSYNHFFWKHTEWRISRVQDKFFVSSREDQYRIVQVFFVHQLQNVIYSLTGDEMIFGCSNIQSHQSQ